MFAPTTIWFASFVTLPAPLCPQSTADLPITLNKGSARLKSLGSPPTIIARSPDIANGSPPETGASIKLTCFLLQRSWISRDTPGSIDDISIIKSPLAAPSSRPFSPRTTALESGLSGTMRIVMSDLDATSADDTPAFAPCCTNSATALEDRL